MQAASIDTLKTLLTIGDDQDIALLAPAREPLRYADLRRLVDYVESELKRRRLDSHVRIAMVLPNGAEMAAAFLAFACHACVAPLNPAYTADEFTFYFTDLKIQALLVARDSGTTAIQVAHQLGIVVLELDSDASGVAGRFTLSSSIGLSQARRIEIENRDGSALLLHTSGTTARPKIVPLTQANLCASARHIAINTRLTRQDRCLNIMPLFHVHGLVAGLLASLYAGASIYCAPGFQALKFFKWLKETQPSWYTAVPTMHEMILTRAAQHSQDLAKNNLRFIRASSAALAPQLMKALENLFAVPVIEAYGMTEAAHQIASNPLPPKQRIPGSVGLAAGPELAIMNEHGEFQTTGGVGEVVIRGANVIAGYENNPKANAECFVKGWFRTGDQGSLDAEGYLRISGRLKEMINRGGEKISPCEIDEALLAHAAVSQAISFAVPHNKLGETLAAAVVLKSGQQLSEKNLRNFLAARLVDFKVPEKIIFLKEIPTSATGKLQRIGLAKKLGLSE